MSNAKNFAYSTVATAPSPATTGTSLVVAGGDGAKFPAVPFQAVIYPTAASPLASNAEVVTVTGVATDTFTIVRAQEDSSARTVVIGDQIAATITGGVMVQSHRFDPITPALQNITLDRSTDFTVDDSYEVSSTNSLEVPATSTLEPIPRVKQAEVQSYFGIYDFIESGCVWTADAAGSTLNATMSEGYVWIGGRRLKVSAVKSRGFTASVDTYVDFSDNGNGTAKITYTETTNNAATGSPTLAPGSLRNAIVVSGVNIAASTSINQGQETMVLPITSSIPYAVTDSLGNLIWPRDPNRKLLGYKQVAANATSTSTTATLVTGLTVPVIVPTGRKVKITVFGEGVANGTAGVNATIAIWDGTVGSGTQLAAGFGMLSTNAVSVAFVESITTPTTASKTYNASIQAPVSGTATLFAAATGPAYIKVELA